MPTTKTQNSKTLVWLTYKLPDGTIATLDYNGNRIPELEGVYSDKLRDKIKEFSNDNTIWAGYNGDINN